MILPFTLPDWLPWWVPLLLLVPALLYALAFLFMPFSVIGVKSRLDVIEARLDEIQGEIRSLALRLREPGAADYRGADFEEVYAPRQNGEANRASQPTTRPPIPPAAHELEQQAPRAATQGWSARTPRREGPRASGPGPGRAEVPAEPSRGWIGLVSGRNPITGRLRAAIFPAAQGRATLFSRSSGIHVRCHLRQPDEHGRHLRLWGAGAAREQGGREHDEVLCDLRTQLREVSEYDATSGKL